MNKAQSTLLPDGRRLHLQHGPCDLIVEAFGDLVEVLKPKELRDEFSAKIKNLNAMYK